MREWAAILVALAACDRSPSVASCAEHLGGVWATDDGSGRWHIRDGGKTLEAYPLVRELPAAAAGTLPAPSMIDLRRQGDEVAGTVVRRWHRGAQTCLMRAPARVRGCRDDRMTLTVGDTGAPVDWHACAAPESAPATQLLRRVWP